MTRDGSSSPGQDSARARRACSSPRSRPLAAHRLGRPAGRGGLRGPAPRPAGQPRHPGQPPPQGGRRRRRRCRRARRTPSARGVELDLDAAAELVAAPRRPARPRASPPSPWPRPRALDLLGDGGELAEECGEWADPCDVRRPSAAARRGTCGPPRRPRRSDRPRAGRSARAGRADPYDERAHRDLMRAPWTDGRGRPGALRRAGARLADELGDRPRPRDPAAPPRGAPRRPPVDAARRAPPDRARRWSAASRSWPPRRGLGGRPRPDGRPWCSWPASRASARPAWSRRPPPTRRPHRWPGARQRGAARVNVRCSSSRSSTCCVPSSSRCPAGTLQTLLGSHLPTWARLLPELAELLEVPPERRVRRAGPAAVLRRRRGGRRRPLGHGSRCCSTARRPAVRRGRRRPTWWPTSGVQLAGARCCSRGHPQRGSPRAPPGDRSVAPGAPGAAPGVGGRGLAAAAGFEARADEVQARTLGHPLSVVASLQALASGSSGVPARRRRGRRRSARRLEPGDRRDRPRRRRPRHLGRPAPARCARRAVGGRRRARRRAADGVGSARGQRVALHLRQRPGARRASWPPGPAAWPWPTTAARPT